MPPKKKPDAKKKPAPKGARGPRLPPDERIFAAKKAPRVPFPFVIDELEHLGPTTRPMFGCIAVYVEEKIVLVLRDKAGPGEHDNGVWVATTRDHHASLRAELPSLRSISVLGTGETGWQMLPADALDFEESALAVCAMIARGDPRVGKVPKPRARRRRPR